MKIYLTNKIKKSAKSQMKFNFEFLVIILEDIYNFVIMNPVNGITDGNLSCDNVFEFLISQFDDSINADIEGLFKHKLKMIEDPDIYNIETKTYKVIKGDAKYDTFNEFMNHYKKLSMKYFSSPSVQFFVHLALIMPIKEDSYENMIRQVFDEYCEFVYDITKRRPTDEFPVIIDAMGMV